MENFTTKQIAAAAVAAEIARLVVLQQWMTREYAKRTEILIAELRTRQLKIETDIEMNN